MKLNLKDQNTKLDGELTPDYLLGLIFRNKKLISLVAFITLFFSLIYAMIKPKVWQGQFDIVLEKNNKDNSNPLNLDSMLSSLIGSSVAETKLETEVGILESPLVLMPTFKFVKSERGINTSSKELLFSSWMNDLETELVENTSILNIRYRDKNKKIIIPVLEKISKDYQKYSGEKRGERCSCQNHT